MISDSGFDPAPIPGAAYPASEIGTSGARFVSPLGRRARQANEGSILAK
jgi:hypothetical protein